MRTYGRLMQSMSWLGRVAEWIWEARLFWLAILAPIGVFWVSWAVLPAWEPRLRITGLVFQLLGLGTVIWGLRGTRRLFRRPTPLKHAAAWFKRFPPYKANASVVVLLGSASSRAAVSGCGMVSLPPNASLEERVVALEQVKGLHSTLIADIRDRIEEELHVRASELESERRERAVEDNKIQGLLEEASAGGLHVDLVGVVWLFFGLIFGTASAEIVKFLGLR